MAASVLPSKANPNAAAKANGAKHPQFVFGDALPRIADRAEPAGRQIVLPADVIDDPLVDRIEKQAVDGEIAAAGVLLGRN